MFWNRTRKITVDDLERAYAEGANAMFDAARAVLGQTTSKIISPKDGREVVKEAAKSYCLTFRAKLAENYNGRTMFREYLEQRVKEPALEDTVMKAYYDPNEIPDAIEPVDEDALDIFHPNSTLLVNKIVPDQYRTILGQAGVIRYKDFIIVYGLKGKVTSALMGCLQGVSFSDAQDAGVSYLKFDVGGREVGVLVKTSEASEIVKAIERMVLLPTLDSFVDIPDVSTDFTLDDIKVIRDKDGQITMNYGSGFGRLIYDQLLLIKIKPTGDWTMRETVDMTISECMKGTTVSRYTTLKDINVITAYRLRSCIEAIYKPTECLDEGTYSGFEDPYPKRNYSYSNTEQG